MNHHSVYVVLLGKDSANAIEVVRAISKYGPGKPTVYVGMTGLPVEERFKNHKLGIKSNKLVERYGIEVLHSESGLSFDRAVALEQGLADNLRGAGYLVLGGS